MKNTKNILSAAAAALTAFTVAFTSISCDKGGGEDKTKLIVGSWELTSIETKSALIGDTPVTVNISFNADGTFSLQQLVGEGRPSNYSGTYTLSGDQLSGTYSDGKAWADSYTAAITQDQMTLTTSNGKETDTYKRK